MAAVPPCCLVFPPQLPRGDNLGNRGCPQFAPGLFQIASEAPPDYTTIPGIGEGQSDPESEF